MKKIVIISVLFFAFSGFSRDLATIVCSYGRTPNAAINNLNLLLNSPRGEYSVVHRGYVYEKAYTISTEIIKSISAVTIIETKSPAHIDYNFEACVSVIAKEKR